VKAGIGALAAAALLAATPAAAQAKTETATSGTVKATLTYRTGEASAKDQHLTITDAGTTVVDEAIPNKLFLTPAGSFGNQRPSLHAEDFDGNGTVEVVVDEYTGGAHCCFDSYLYEGATKTIHHWGDVWYRFKDIGGSRLFLSADPAFSGAFTSFAASAFPIQVWDWQGSALVDVSRSAAVRPLVRKDADRWRRHYRRAARKGQDEPVRSTLAAYAADRLLLGEGIGILDKAAARGEVRKNFPMQVRRLLRKLGYFG